MFVIYQLGVSVATNVFEEHKELLEKLRSIPSKKRKKLANQMFKKAKKIKLGGKDRKRKIEPGSRKKEEGTLQIGGEDIDISEIVFEEELVEEKMEIEQKRDAKMEEEEEEEEDAMLTQEEEELAKIEIELKVMDNDTPPISPPPSKKDSPSRKRATASMARQMRQDEEELAKLETEIDDMSPSTAPSARFSPPPKEQYKPPGTKAIQIIPLDSSSSHRAPSPRSAPPPRTPRTSPPTPSPSTPPPPRTPSPPLTEKDIAQVLLAASPPSTKHSIKEKEAALVEDVDDDGEFKPPDTLDDLISALDLTISSEVC